MPNRLVHTTSPYLLQHAHQPVAWYPWGEEALNKAQQEDMPILVSIGYTACHWCHVMAKEAFEDRAIATLMNKHFVCIKVDREERPDIDQVYVAAAQAMGLQAGWPLHLFLLPDQKPFYGGLYFPPEAWKQVLTQVAKAFRNHREQLTASATQFTQALNAAEASCQEANLAPDRFTQANATQYFHQLYQTLDHAQGGLCGAPKFPMPSIGLFLLHYYCLTQDERAWAQLNLTLERIAQGGIYDQLGGGFARYATDEAWQLPHFEKMLYDNGQLLSLYAHAYTATQNPLYKNIVQATTAFVAREMKNPAGGFFSALDADSEGVEGKFYTWTKAEVEAVLGKEAPLFIEHFSITASGNWEQGTNVLYQKAGSALSAVAQAKIAHAQSTLFTVRDHRTPPTRDEKVITSWNAMMLQGLVDTYNTLGEEYYLNLALHNAQFIEKYLKKGNKLYHSYCQGQAAAAGYLEDYAWVAQALLSLYQATFKEHWLHTAQALVQYTIDHFYDTHTGLYYFVEESEAKLIARQRGLFDHSMPSANAVMARNLLDLGVLLDVQAYVTTAEQMLDRIRPLLHHAPPYLASWATLSMQQLKPTIVVAIVGPLCQAWAQALKQHRLSGVLLAGTTSTSDLPWLANKKTDSTKTTIYVCQQRACQTPTHSVDEALAQLTSLKSAWTV